MANELPINLVLAGSLPSGFVGTPQQIAEAIIARARLQTTQSFSLFATGSTAPSSNVGPWLKDNSEWWVWDDETGGYVPQTVNPDSFADNAIPASKLEIGAVTNPYLFLATTSGTTQIVNTSASSPGWTDILFNTERFDPYGVYDPVNSIFTAPKAGWYQMSYYFQVQNVDGVASNMQIGIYPADVSNNANVGPGVNNGVPSPVGSRWYLSQTGLTQLTEGQQLKLRLEAVDGTGTGTISVSGNCYWTMHFLKELTA